MNKNFILKGYIIIFLVMQSVTGVYAQEQFSAAQLKQVKQISTLFLNSQSAEKKRINKAISEDIVILETTEKYIQAVLDQDLKSVKKVNANSVQEGKKKDTKLAKVSDLKIGKLLSHVNVSRQTIKDQLPSRLLLWKTKSKADKRKQKILNLLDSVEAEVKKNAINKKSLIALKEKVTLNKIKTGSNRNRPTIVPYAGTNKKIPMPRKRQ